MSFSIHESKVVLCSNETILIYKFDNDTYEFLEIPKLENSKKEIPLHNNEEVESCHTLTSVNFSKDGKYFAVCTKRKQLCFFDNETNKLVSNFCVQRAASKISFIPDNDIVVADKSGDAYLFSANDINSTGKLLLGHLSMLLDILVTDDQKYIITADRDEKIRVSMFPDCYNILSYCLGHKSFVTNVAIIPHDKNILVSAGGDGNMKFWNFLSGTEIASINFQDDLPSVDIGKLNHSFKDFELDNDIVALPVKSLNISKKGTDESLLSLTFYFSQIILIYRITGKENKLNVKLINSLTTDKEPLDCKHHNNWLYILTDNGLNILDPENQLIDTNVIKNLNLVNEKWKSFHKSARQSLLNILYKRKYDNVQEYQEKKKLRLCKNDS